MTPVPTPPEAEAAFAQAIIQKAARLWAIQGAPLGTWGEAGEYGPIEVRRDTAVEELLYGWRFRQWDVDLRQLVTVDDVIRSGLEIPGEFPTAQRPDLERVLDAAVGWVAHYLSQGIGIA